MKGSGGTPTMSLCFFVYKGSRWIGLRSTEIETSFPRVEVEILVGKPTGFKVGDEFYVRGNADDVQAFLDQHPHS